MSIPKRVRYEVLRRDNHACRYCGAKAPFAELHIDHVIPRSRGGADESWNLTAACVDCNLSKGDGIPNEHVIQEVREDETSYQVSKGLPVYACIHCAKPLQHGPDEEVPTQCEPCNIAVVEAYEYGLKSGRGMIR